MDPHDRDEELSCDEAPGPIRPLKAPNMNITNNKRLSMSRLPVLRKTSATVAPRPEMLDSTPPPSPGVRTQKSPIPTGMPTIMKRSASTRYNNGMFSFY